MLQRGTDLRDPAATSTCPSGWRIYASSKNIQASNTASFGARLKALLDKAKTGCPS
jgi:hypothetical protein